MHKPNKAPKTASKPAHKRGAAAAAGAKHSHKPAAQPAKKAPPVKKKTQPIVVTKKGGAKPGAKPAAAHAAPKTHGKKEAPKKSHLAHEKAGKSHAGEKAHERAHHPAKPAAPKAEAHAAHGKRKLATHAPVKPAAAKAHAPAAHAKPAKESAKAAPTALGHPAKEVAAEPAKAAKAKKAPELERVVEAAPTDEEVILTDAEGRRYCRMKDCDQAATVDGGYCRYHYLLFWKNIQSRKKILSEGKLERYIEELTARYPDKYLELLRKDLRSEKDFMAAIQELEIDDSGVDNEFEDEAQSYLDEVRGVTGEANNEREEDF